MPTMPVPAPRFFRPNRRAWPALAAGGLAALCATGALAVTTVVGGTAEVQLPWLNAGGAGADRWVRSDVLGTAAVVEHGGGRLDGNGSWTSTGLDARADALRGILQMRFSLSALGTADDTAAVRFDKLVQVQAGNSGLAAGDPVGIDVLMQLHGTSHAGPPGIDGSLPQATELGRDHFNRTGERYMAVSEVRADYAVRDLSRQVCTEGCSAAQVLSFGYGAHVLYDTLYGAEIDATWRAAQTFQQLGSTFTPQSWNGDTHVGWFGAFASETVDIGLIRLHIDTQVGSFLQISGSISSLLQVYGTKTAGMALNEFGHTFDVDLVGSLPGVQIAGELPTITAVPEPAAWTLWSAALVAGAALRRRRR
jgi:hypothetical protein